jgi:hypothetical protein
VSRRTTGRSAKRSRRGQVDGLIGGWLGGWIGKVARTRYEPPTWTLSMKSEITPRPFEVTTIWCHKPSSNQSFRCATQLQPFDFNDDFSAQRKIITCRFAPTVYLPPPSCGAQARRRKPSGVSARSRIGETMALGWAACTLSHKLIDHEAPIFCSSREVASWPKGKLTWLPDWR